MKRKIVSLVTMMCMALTLCACNKPQESTVEIASVENCNAVGLQFNIQAESLEKVKDKQSFLEALSICIDRAYAREMAGADDKALVQSQFMKAHKCNADMSGVLKCEEAMEILEGYGFEFTPEGDGTYYCDPQITIPFEVSEGDEVAARVAATVQADLEVIGVKIDIVQYEESEYKQLVADNKYNLIINTSNNEEDNGFIPLWQIK